MDQEMFNAVAQSQAAFSQKQDAMENQYISSMDVYNQKKDQINKYNTQVKDTARQQLNR